MEADLICPECEGGAKRPMSTDFYERCMLCRGEGRRLPELREWDALRAERDHARDEADRLAALVEHMEAEGPHRPCVHGRCGEAFEDVTLDRQPTSVRTFRAALGCTEDAREAEST